ncbi:MAG TPA: hypothetical protein VN625_01630 [Desulfuromonadaceae bacterium]|nr:hypothetical protein [Desulfuromonadaceae bacterium]
MTRLRILACSSAVLAALVFFCGCESPATVKKGRGLVINRAWLTNASPAITPPAYCRPPDQTFLTYPEWFLVFGPREQADFFTNHTSTKFPFTTHIRQIWGGYGTVYDQIRGNYPFNTGYHVMIVVIATSSTAEFGFKGFYERIIGRMTDTRDDQTMTDEDIFNAQFTRDYVNFLDTAPWYKFNFLSQLGKLWTGTSLIGRHPIRKWERKIYLSTELGFKTIYGGLIWAATRTAYEPAKPTTAVVVDHLPEDIRNRLHELNVLTNYPDGSALITLPRYAPFVTNACELAAEGVSFKEIAGNSSAIMITVLAPKSWNTNSDDFKSIFIQPIPTRPGLNRVAIATPVPSLQKTLQQLSGEKIEIEHIYDF